MPALLFYFIVLKNFLPNGDNGTIFCFIQLPIGVSSERAQKFQDAVNDIFKKNNNVARFFTITGMYTGADQSTGLLTIMLKDKKNRKGMNEVLAGLRDKFAKMPFNLGSVYLSPVPCYSHKYWRRNDCEWRAIYISHNGIEQRQSFSIWADV